MPKNLKKLIRKKLRLGLKKAYFSFALVSILLNTMTPFFASYNYVAYAQDTPESSSSADKPTEPDKSAEEVPVPQEETTTPEEPQIDETIIEETPQEIIAPVEEPVVASAQTEDPIVDETVEPTTEPSQGDVPEDTAADFKEEPATPQDIVEAKEQVSEKECIASDAQIETADESVWNKNDGEKSTETNDNVQLGVKYEFPFNKEVSLTFTCLPKNEEDRSKLSIKQLDINDINLPEEVNAVGDYAYDLNTEMENGTFEYTLTLPKPENVDAQVQYIEKSEEEVTQHDVAKEDVKEVSDEYTDQKSDGGSVKVTELDHFTVFIITDDVANYTGSWFDFPTQGHNDDGVHFSTTVAAGDTVTWDFSTISGVRKVYVSWSTNPNRTTAAPYVLNHVGGSDPFTINQELLADQTATGTPGEWSGWHYLDTVTLDDASNLVLTGVNNASGTDYVIADEVALVGMNEVWVDDDWALNNIGDEVGAGQIFGGNAFATVQEGIDAVDVGGTVNVAAGTYLELGQIVIDKDITIVGEDKTTTIIKPAQNTGGTPHVDASAWILVNSGETFNLNKVTLDGAGKQIAIGLLSHGHGTISDSAFTNIGYNTYAGMAIELYGSDATVSNNSFSNIQRIGVYNGFGTNSQIIGNTYVGKGDGEFLDYAFEVGRNGYSTISDNTISDNRGVAYDGSTSAGVLVTSYYNPGTPSGATITGNTISDSTQAIAVGYDSGDASVVVANNNLFDNNEYGVVSTNPIVDATNNWWGDISGPSEEGTGIGDAVSEFVTYSPWCLTSNCSTDSSVYTDSRGVNLSGTPQDVVVGDITINDVAGTGSLFVAKYAGEPSTGGLSVGVPGFYYDIQQTGADFPLSVVVNYGPLVDDTLLSSLYYYNGTWHDYMLDTLGTTGYAQSTVTVDKLANTITASLQHLTPIVLATDTSGPSIPTNGNPNGIHIPTNVFDFTWDASTDVSEPITYVFHSSLNPAQLGGVLTIGLWTSGVLTTNSIHSSGAPNGTWYWQVQATDALGNTSAWSPIWDVTLDTVYPTINFINDVEAGPVTNDTLNVTVSDLNPDPTSYGFAYTDGTCSDTTVFTNTFTSGSDWTETSGGNNGKFICVKASDLAGNTSYSVSGNDLNIDSSAPSAPSLVGPADGSVKKPAGLLLDWTDETDPNGPVTYKYKSAYSGGNYGPDSTGTASQINASGSADRVYSWQVQACDSLNNCSVWSGPWVVTVDSVLPSLNFTDNVALGPVTSDSITLTTSDINSNPSSYEYGFSSDSVCNAGDTFGNAFTSGTPFTLSTETNNGNYICARASDLAGNTRYLSSTNVLNIDVTAPDVEITSPTAGIIAGTISISGTVTDANPHHYWLVIQNSGGTTIAGPGTVNNATSFTDQLFFNWDTTAVSDGIYTIKLEARDAVDNKDAGSIDWNTITVDNTSPTVDLVFPSIGPTATSFEAHFSENVNEAEAENPANYFLNNWPGAGGSGDLADDATIVYDSLTTTATITFSNPVWYVSPEQQWGLQDIHDIVGNLLSVNPYSEYSTAMVAPVTTDVGTDANWHNTDVTVTFSCTDIAGSGCSKTYYTTDGTVPTTASTFGNSVTLSTDGVYTIKYFSVDNAGNEETIQTAANTVKVDKTNPIDPSPTSTSHTTSVWSNDNQVDVSWSGASDVLSDVDGFYTEWNTSPSTMIGPVVKEYAATATDETSPILSDGSSHYFHIATLDNAGNWTSTAHLGPFYIDTVEPTGTVTLGTTILHDADLIQEVTVTYNEDMNLSSTPTITFGATTGTWTPGVGSWTSGTVWEQNFTITDADEEVIGVTAAASSAQDLATNTQVTTPETTFDIDTKNPLLTGFTTTTTNGFYGPASTINITANYSEDLGSGSTITVVLDTGVSVTLTTIATNTLSGTYTVGALGSGENSQDLTVSSITSQVAIDIVGNTQTSTTLPATNIADSHEVVVDTTSPVLSYSIDPATPNGRDDWYKGDMPKITLGATDTNLDRIEYRFSLTDLWTLYTGQVEVEDGEREFYYRAVDLAGNIIEPAKKDIKVDTDSPSSVSDVGATYNEDANTVTLDWNIDDSDIKEVRIYKGTSSDFDIDFLNRVSTQSDSDEDYTDSGDLGIAISRGNTYYYKLIAIDRAGNRSNTKAVSIEIPTEGASVTTVVELPVETGDVLGQKSEDEPTVSSTTSPAGDNLLGAETNRERFPNWLILLLSFLAFVGFGYWMVGRGRGK